jgi:protein phosphatase
VSLAGDSGDSGDSGDAAGARDEPAPGAIVLPEPCLVVLVGAAGSGKSTLAARLFSPDQVLSSDAHRALVRGDAADQAVTRTAFSILHRRLAQRMAEHRTTVVDATNVTAFARRSLVRRAVSNGIPAIAIVLDLPPTLVLARNATRDGRIVPEDAVRRQLGDLAASLRRGRLSTDGFARVHVIRTPRQLDELALAREPAAEAAT